MSEASFTLNENGSRGRIPGCRSAVVGRHGGADLVPRETLGRAGGLRLTPGSRGFLFAARRFPERRWPYSSDNPCGNHSKPLKTLPCSPFRHAPDTSGGSTVWRALKAAMTLPFPAKRR